MAGEGEADLGGVYAQEADPGVALQQAYYGVAVMDLLVDGALLAAVHAQLRVADGEPGR